MLRKRLNTRLLGTLLAAALGAILAAPASAGTYTVNSCGQSTSRSLAGWTFDGTGGASGSYADYFLTANSCGSYGIYRAFANVNPIPAGAQAAWTWNTPPGTTIVSAQLFQSINYRSTGAYDSIVAVRGDGAKTLVSSVVGTGNASSFQGGATYTLPSGSNPTVAFRTELGCQPSANCNPQVSGQNGNEWSLTGAIITLNDPTTPSADTIGGEAWKAAPADGNNAVTYSVNDGGSGIKTVDFYVDGVKRATNASGCTVGAYLPCPLTDGGQFTLDTTQLSEGDHALKLTVTDYAGNASDSTQTATIRRKPALATDAGTGSTSDPTITTINAPFTVGEDATGNRGSWTGSGITYSYQWQRCDVQGQNCTPISGATGLTYSTTTEDAGHTLVFCVTATNTGGSTTVCSQPSPVVEADSDRDGVPNSIDKCPSTAASTADGCPASSGTSVTLSPVEAPVTVQGSRGTSGGDRGAPNGSPASDKVVLTVFANNREATRKAKFGKRVPITGRLIAPNGTPIAGATVSVQTRTAVPGAALADTSRIVTGSDGRFTYVAPAGPSRVIRFGYRAYSADTSFADTTDVTLLVAAGVTMRATPKQVHNRNATVFTGRLLGKPLAKRGIVVDLQVFFRHQWRTFAAPRTNSRGVYRFRYRFMAGAATWRFRARVRKVLEYPYELGTSRGTVKVKVLG